MATPTPTPSRATMLEVADYLDALVPKSAFLAQIALRAVSKLLRERAPKEGPWEKRARETWGKA